MKEKIQIGKYFPRIYFLSGTDPSSQIAISSLANLCRSFNKSGHRERAHGDFTASLEGLASRFPVTSIPSYNRL
jgi:hypothetical protein